MDIYCPKCAEPWEIDSIHENDVGLPFKRAYTLFRTKGCGAIFDVTCRPAVGAARTRALITGDLAELMGDDVDGLGALLEDFGI